MVWTGLDILEDDDWYALFVAEFEELVKLIQEENPLIPLVCKVVWSHDEL